MAARGVISGGGVVVLYFIGVSIYFNCMPHYLDGFCWSIDVAGRMRRCGWLLAAWTGRSQEALVAAQGPIIHPYDKTRWAAMCAAAMANRTEFTSRHRLQRWDGAWVWCLVHGWPVWSGQAVERYDGVSPPLDVLDVGDLNFGCQALQRVQACRMRN